MGSPGPSDDGTPLKHPTTIGRWPRGIAYNGGFYILGTPIGLGNATGAGLHFVSTLEDPLPQRGSRVIANRFIASAIGAEKRGLDALSLDFGQTIKLGRMEMCLFPAGLGPGSAQFLVTFQHTRILYCGGVSLRRPLSSQPTEVPSCDLLLLDVPSADPKPPAPVRVGPKLLAWVKTVMAGGGVPVVAVGSDAAAFDALSVLRPLGVTIRAQRTIFETCRRVEAYHSFSPHLRRLEQRLPSSGIVLYPSAHWRTSSLFDASSAKVAYAGPGRTPPDWSCTAFRLGEGEDRPGLLAYAKRTGASRVALGARCDAKLAALLSKTGVETYQVTPPTQLPFPF